MRNLLLSQSPMLLITIYLTAISISMFYQSYIPIYLIIPITMLLFYFYRFPTRKCLSRKTDITSPADGTITNIVTDPKTKRTTISIFLSPLDVHIQYIPYSGKIISQKYETGTFHPAYLFKKSKYNENNEITIETNSSTNTIKVKQIAGLLARRIVCQPKTGDTVKKGEPYGMIKLSSRVDITLPANVEILVSKNERVKGCETTIAKFTQL